MCLCNLIKRRIGNIAHMQARAGVCKALGNDPPDTAGPCSYQNTKLKIVFCVSSHFSSPNIKVKVVIAFEVKRRIHLIEAGDIKRQSSQNFTNIPHLTGRLSSRDLKAPRFDKIYPQP